MPGWISIDKPMGCGPSSAGRAGPRDKRTGGRGGHRSAVQNRKGSTIAFSKARRRIPHSQSCSKLDKGSAMSAAKTTLRRIWNALGPGLTTGAADDDPSGIATYSQAGAQFGFALTWTMFLTLPFMAAIQIISACIGWQTRYGLARNIGLRLPAPALYALVTLLINIAADLAAILGEALRLVIGTLAHAVGMAGSGADGSRRRPALMVELWHLERPPRPSTSARACPSRPTAPAPRLPAP